jgi:predicted amidophosphoribosyltransferase
MNTPLMDEFNKKFRPKPEGCCLDCGEPLNNAEGTYCPECLSSRNEDKADECKEEQTNNLTINL